MMFSVSFPDSCHEERRWISLVLLREFLGIDHDIRFGSQEEVRIEEGGKTLVMPDTFFKNAGAKWLSTETLPVGPLRHWAVSEMHLAPELVEPSIPIIFGHPVYQMSNGNASLGLDIFGSAFFLLSRYEEAASKQRDNHDRFPAPASVAYREGFLDRPIIDEYVEILWSAMTQLWPQARRRQHEYKTVISCDVDHPYHPSATSFHRMARTTAAKVIRSHGNLAGSLTPFRNYLSGRYGDLRHDPYYFTVDWIMDVNEKVGNTVVFNFIPEATDPTFDLAPPITDPAVMAMLKRIDMRHHEIGIHPGYRTYLSMERTRSGLTKLCDALRQAGITQSVTGGRNHYLRWSTETPAIWNAAGLQYDSTLGYADEAGFRCGTCREYPMFDLHQRNPLEIRERPLVCMDGTLITYKEYGYTSAVLDEMTKLKSAVRKVKGSFTLLWHNSNLETDKAREIYCEIIK